MLDELELLAWVSDGRYPCPDVSGLVTANDKSCALLAARRTTLEGHAVAFRPNLGQPSGLFVDLSPSSHVVQTVPSRRPEFSITVISEGRSDGHQLTVADR